MQQITEWLAKIGLERYAPAFVENDIDVSVLRYLTDADLEKIGVSLGHRRKLLAAIAELGGGPAAPTLPATDPRKQDAERTGPAPSVGPAAPPPRAASTESAERRYLTVMFCDLVGSTEISAQLDAEEWRDLVGSYLDAASAAVAEMGGHVAKKLGDGLLALFGYPLAHENDVERAVRAALSIQRALNELNRKNAGTGKSVLTARIGLETGPVVVDAAGEIFGDAPNVAARVQALAEPGTVLVTGRVRREVAGLFVAEERGTRVLKGIPEPVALYRLVRASGAGRRSGQRQLTSLIGRDDEITMLTRRWERARQGDGQLVMIVGEPGLGKSRLIEEFHSRLSDTPHTWVEWSCSQLLQNTPLHPIAEWGRQRFGGGDVSAERRLADLESSLAQVRLDPAENVPLLAPLLDIPLPPDREPALAAEELRRRQLAALTNWVLAGARVQPVVLAFEDLHWADPTTLDVLRGIAERGALAPLFVVATTRPEFRPSWGMRSHHGTISLAPLDRAQVRDMVAELSARHALPHEVVEDVAARTGGVPLFVEEVTRLLLERGEQGGIHAIPPTLQQSLTARLDRLGPAREVAQIGAVIGRGFSYGLLRAVAGMDDAPLQAALEKLADADILLVQVRRVHSGLPKDLRRAGGGTCDHGRRHCRDRPARGARVKRVRPLPRRKHSPPASVGSLNRAEPLKMREAAAAFLHETARRPDSPEAGVAYRIAGLTHLYFGDYAAARTDIEKALDVLDSERDRDLAFRFGQDQVAAAMIYLALVLWPLGDVGRARQFANQAASQAAKSGNVQTLAYVNYHLCLFEALRGDRRRASPVAKAVLDLARERAMPIWESAGRLLNGWANWLVGDQRMELAEMRRGIERWCELGQAWHRPYFGALLSEAEADAGNVDIAVTEVDRLLAEASSTGQHWSDAELHRIRGELLIKRDPANTAPAEEAFVTAIAVAREQTARSFELRAALALAKLHRSTGRPAEAHAALAPALEGFLATPEFPEIEEAQNLLAALAQSDEVKKEIALRQRRFRLQTAYSNALLHGRGISPPETTAAFAKARELAASIEDPVERFSAYYGLWVGPFIRGNLAQMREVAEAFMRDAERSPALPEAGIAHRLLGTTCWYTGDYAGARLHLDEALARYDHARDLHLTSSFAYDQGAVAEFYLGMTLYALGEIDRGACLVEDSLGLALQGGHIPTVALTRHYMIVFAAVRRDLDRATPHAQALLDLGLTHGLPSWHGFAKFTLAWALRRDNPQALVEMRAALTLQREMDFRVEQPLFGTLLAEAEAAAGERDAALATVVEQLAAIEQTGERWFAAEVHRARGEILLNRNPGNTAPAEEAFHTATAIAREQKAKSFELRAALSLAKLYQSGSRPLEAHAILASALEGFSPTPEFPEIAEARALLAALAS